MPPHTQPPRTTRVQKPVHDEFSEDEMFSSAATSGPMPHPPQFRMPQPRMQAPPIAQAAANPLAKYFRQPGLSVKLPTNGAYIPPGGITMSPVGDVEVWPMRAADEILLKSPDALMSGIAIEKLLQSCVPAIHAPRLVSQPDLDVLLLAIRAATYGSKMGVTANCPECGTENSFDVNLPALLQNITAIPSEWPVQVTDEVIVFIRPYNMGNASRVAMAGFEETRRLQALDADPATTTEVKTKAMSASIDRLGALNFEVMADCVERIVVPEGEVDQPEIIADFMQNVSRAWVKKIEEAQKEMNGLGMDKKIACTCTKCSHEWKTELEFNPANFFA